MYSLSLEVGTAGGLNNFVDYRTKKSRSVFLFPTVIVHLSEKNKAVIDFTAQLFGVQEPDKTKKTLSILKRTLTMMEKSEMSKTPIQNKCYAKSTPGPKLPALALDESYSAVDSLRIVYFLGKILVQL